MVTERFKVGDTCVVQVGYVYNESIADQNGKLWFVQWENPPAAGELATLVKAAFGWVLQEKGDDKS